MKMKLLAALGAGAALAAVTLTPAAAQVRGVSAIGPSGTTRVDVNVTVETSDRYRDDRYDNAYYDDGYYDDGYYRERTYDDRRYYEDSYHRSRDTRRGEVYYPRNDNTGEVIAGVLVGAIIGYALADDNDHHHHYRSHYSRRSHAYRGHDRRYDHGRRRYGH